MKALYIIGQIIGACLIVYNVFIYATKKRDGILTRKLIADIATEVQNLCVGTYTGAALLCVAIARDVVFLNKDKHKWARHRVWLYVFLIGMCISPIVTWAGWTSLLPMAGSLILSLGLYCSNSKLTRSLAPIGLSLWVIYSLCHSNYAQAICDALAATISVVTLLRDNAKERKQKTAGERTEETAQAEPSTEQKD